MADYKEMYLTLFRETTAAISALQEAQCKTEEMFMSDNSAEHLLVFSSADAAEENK